MVGLVLSFYNGERREKCRWETGEAEMFSCVCEYERVCVSVCVCTCYTCLLESYKHAFPCLDFAFGKGEPIWDILTR